MRPSRLTAQFMGATAIVLLLSGAPLTVKIDQGLQIAPTQAWADNDRGDDHGGRDGGSDHGGSGGDDHSGSSGGDDHGGSNADDGDRDHGGDDGSQERSQDQDRLEQEREAWLGVPDRNQGGDAQAGNGKALVPVPEDQERQLIERGWASDDASGDD